MKLKKYLFLTLSMCLLLPVANKTEATSDKSDSIEQFEAISNLEIPTEIENIASLLEKDTFITSEIKEKQAEQNNARQMLRATYQPIQKFPTIILDYGRALPEKFSFMAVMTDETEVINERTKQVIQTSISQVWPNFGQVATFESKSDPGVIRVTHVGFYNGQDLDLLINTTYISKVTADGVEPIIELGMEPKNFLSIYVNGGKNTEFNIRLDTVKSGTNERVNTSGIVPLENLTPIKDIMLQKNNIKMIYTHEKSTISYLDNPANTINGSPAIMFTSDETGYTETNRMVHVYEDSSFRSIGIFMKKSGRTIFSLYQTSQSPIRVDFPTPDIIGSEVNPHERKAHYKVKQYIPSEPAGQEMTKYDLKVVLPSNLKPVNLEEVTISDKNKTLEDSAITKRIEIVGGQQIIHFEATPDYLKSNPQNALGLYGNYQQIDIPVELDYSKDYSNYENLEKNEIAIPAFATLETNLPYKTVTSKETVAKFSNQSTTKVKYQDEKGRALAPEKEIAFRIGSPYSVEIDGDKGGYVLKETIGAVNGVQTLEPIEVVHIFQDKRFELAGTIENLTHKDSNELYWGDELKIDYILKSNLVDVDNEFIHPATTYKKMVLTSTFDSRMLATPENLQLMDGEGNIIGTAVFDTDNQTIVAELRDSSFSWQKDIQLTYTTYVKDNIFKDSFLNIDFHSVSEFSDGGLSDVQEAHLKSKEIEESLLEIVSMPSSFDYGKIQLNGKHAEYGIMKMSAPLTIKDNRSREAQWALYAELTSEFIGEKKKKKLPNILKYKKNKEKKVFVKGEQILIDSATSNSKVEKEVSKNWMTNEEGIILEDSFEGAYKDNYSATITWMVKDTPDID